MVKVNLNKAAMKAAYADIAKKIEDADRKFRRQYEGKPVAEVKPRVKAAFGGIGLELPASQIENYANAVSSRSPFKWVLS